MSFVVCPSDFPRKRREIVETLTAMAKTVEPFAGARIAAGVVNRNRLVSVGTNLKKTSPFQQKWGRNKEAKFFHAEVLAIKNALHQISVTELERSEIIVVRAKFSGEDRQRFVSGLAKPCEGCANCIGAFGLRRAWFSTEAGTLDCVDLRH